MTYETQPNKNGCIDLETPALVLLDDGTQIEAQHQFTNTDGQLCVYLQAREAGIDGRINLDHIVAVIETIRCARAFGVEDEFRSAFGTEQELVADGGRDVPVCTCGADLLETAELDTAYYPAPGAHEPHPTIHEGPAATCSACGEHVGAMYGMEAVIAVWEARGEVPPGHDDADNDDDGDEPRFVADGGTVIDPGSLVNHDGHTWTVARANTEYVKLHAQDASPRVAPISDVDPVSGGEDSW